MPKSEVPGEVSSPTQPIPSKPPPFARQVFRPEDVNPFMSPEEQARLKQAVRDAANEGMFTPSSHLRSHIQFPGAWGGANWGSTAADPATGMLFVRSLEMPSYRRMAVNTPSQSPAVSPAGPREQQGLASLHTDLRRVSRPGPDADAIAGEAGPGELPIAAAAGPGTDAGVPGDDAVAGGRGRPRSVSSQPAARGPRAGRERNASSAAEPRTLLRSRGALRGLVLGRMVYEQRASRGRAAVDAARRVRPQRRHDQVARPRWTGAGARRAGDHEHRHRASEKRSGRHRGRPGVRRELAGPHAPRVRHERLAACCGSGSSRRTPRGFRQSTKSAAVNTSPLPQARRGVPEPIRSGRMPFTGNRERSKRRDITSSRCRRRGRPIGNKRCFSSRRHGDTANTEMSRYGLVSPRLA